MARAQRNLETLEFFGIFKEAITLIFTHKIIFLQISLTLILPLSLACLAHIAVSLLILFTTSYTKILLIWLLNMLLFSLLLALFFLSTSVVAYSVALIYSGNTYPAFTHTFAVLQVARKRLIRTFVSGFGIILAYNCVLIFLFSVIYSTLYSSTGADLQHFHRIRLCSNIDIENGLLLGFYGLYLLGLFYMGVIWQLTIPILVLEEESYGIDAMKKSKDLLKGKMWTGLAIVVAGTLWGGGATSLFARFVVFEDSTNIIGRVGFGLISLLLFIVLFLLGHVVQSVFYFVDKSYHRESIDFESVLHDRSMSDVGVYAPLDAAETRVWPSLA